MQIGIRGNTRVVRLAGAVAQARLRGDRDRALPRTRYQKCIDIIGERLGDEPVYITFDLDCLDPTVAPAVSNLEAGVEGFRIDEVMRMLRVPARAANVIGGDVVCLMPTKDQPNNITAMVAAAVMFEMIALVIEGREGSRRRRDPAGLTVQARRHRQAPFGSDGDTVRCSTVTFPGPARSVGPLAPRYSRCTKRQPAPTKWTPAACICRCDAATQSSSGLVRAV